MGCVVAIESESPTLPQDTEVQPILRVVDTKSVLTPDLLELAEWIADYYVAPPGEVIRGLLPPETPRSETVRYERTETAREASLREGSLRSRLLEALDRPMSARALARKVGSRQVGAALRFLEGAGWIQSVTRRQATGGRTVLAARLTEKGQRILASGSARPTVARVLTLLATATDAVPLRTIRNELGLKRGPFQSLSRNGAIRLEKQHAPETPWGRLHEPEGREHLLTEAQQTIVHQLEAALRSRRYEAMVLHGVTGSGKTEVYLRAVAAALREEKSALLLVPEIGLTPRLAGLLRDRFGNRVAILHSSLGTGERREEWRRIRRGEARVVVGARAAVLAPITRLGLVVVDEEHESSYKQEEAPRYHARDLAVKRAKDENAVVVLGSATPSLNSYARAKEGRYTLASLPERIGRRPLARVDLIDMKDVVREEGPETILSRPLREAIECRLRSGEQALILLNRRGYATQLVCRQCGLAAQCTQCSVALTLHRQGRLAVCHYCGLGRPTPERCDVCQGEYLRQAGYGTERVEGEVRKLFGAVRLERMDRDTMRRKGSHESLLSRFGSGLVDVLVGTQMLAKGHDFPAVTLVGVLAADLGLGVPDFRAAERTFQLLTQVAGRAGRGDRPGQVLIQTFSPEHYALRYAAAQDFEGFYEEEMRFRRALGYPPVVSLINLIFQAESMAVAAREARRVATSLGRPALEGVRILGPGFAARSKVAGRYRCQVLVKVPRQKHRAIRERLRAVIEDPAIGRVMTVDVDPVTVH